MDGDLSPIFISILFVLFADYIAVAETALASCSKVKMKTLSEHGDKRAKAVLDALDHFDRTISTILICTNIAHLSTASLITVFVTRRFGLSAVTVSTILTSLFVFFFAEMLPKSIAKKYSDPLALSAIGPLTFLDKLFMPASAALSAIGSLASRLSEGDPEVSVTEDEIHEIIDGLTEEGTLDSDRGDLISSALDFGEITVESVLTPRVDMVAIDIEDDKEEILSFIKNQNHSRIPVYEDSIDNIIGVLRIRRYIRAYLEQGKDLNIVRLLDEPFYVTESARIHELLPRMSRERQSLAIVTDHYGGTVGIVTVEDILESLVGDIWDEEDVVELPIERLENGSYLVDAAETVGDAFDEIGFEGPDDGDEFLGKRLGEWVYEYFQEVPRAREHFDYHGLRVYVAQMDHNRIRKVMLKVLKEKPGEGGDA
ncbi:MAG: hemolysin family protein [Lachnospiraceae bacterium]|nr:hemolysin family protein [Lachnospiraceae bacterium]